MKEKMQHLLENIKKDLIYMANEVEDMIYKSLKAVERQDQELAREVIEIDKRIDSQEVNIEDKLLSLMALQQPVAVDLRFIVGALKMNNDLERIGDHATNIANTAIELTGEPYIKPLEDLPRMGKIARSMLHDAVHAFINQNADLARDVCIRDDEVDKLHNNIQREIIQVLQDKKEKIKQGFALISIASDIERVADLSTNLGEEVVFMREARIIRHGRVEDDQKNLRR